MSSPGPLVDEMCENSGHLQRQQKKQYTGKRARFSIKVKETEYSIKRCSYKGFCSAWNKSSRERV